jgi:hypothetical protein
VASLKAHIIQSAAASAALYPVIGEDVIPFGLAVVLIDVDHVIEYVRDMKSPNLMGVFPYYAFIDENLDKNYLALCVFHTAEFMAFVFALSLKFPVFSYILAGMLFHLMLDVWGLVRRGHPFMRAYSIFEYMLRKRSTTAVTSVRALIDMEDLHTSGVADADHWLRQWRSEG